MLTPPTTVVELTELKAANPLTIEALVNAGELAVKYPTAAAWELLFDGSKTVNVHIYVRSFDLKGILKVLASTIVTPMLSFRFTQAVKGLGLKDLIPQAELQDRGSIWHIQNRGNQKFLASRI